jgi:hypothetical protein
MSDPYPAFTQFGRGSCTCGGSSVGCAVCSTAAILVRFGKPIPRLSDGTPNMVELGRRMGARHRLNDARVKHGLCAYNQNWCTYCAYLELRAAGIPVAHGRLTWTQIDAHLRLKHPIVIPGLYGRLPRVSPSSYSKTVPARGRSDSFTAAHMMVGWDAAGRHLDGTTATYNVSDSDFGSPSRPVMPPHSVLTAAVLRSFWSSLGWSVCYVLQAPPSLTVSYDVVVKPGEIHKYFLDATRTRVASRKLVTTKGFRVPAKDLGRLPWPDAKTTKRIIAANRSGRIVYLSTANTRVTLVRKA